MSDMDLRRQVEALRAKVDELRQSASITSTPVGTKLHKGRSNSRGHDSEEAAGRESSHSKKTEAGMTQEQLAEFKKQQLLVNTLQNRIKELESKLAEAQAAIQEENDRITQLTQEEESHTKALYREVDAINCDLSEKIALQRNEVKKLAGDEHRPINYDPFNYGEAYGGDLVDFQSRKRIIELKLQMNNLQNSLATVASHIQVSPSIDLGYKVVRMDQLLNATGFDRDFQAGTVTRDHALLLSQAKQRSADRVNYPRSEAFQTDHKEESQWNHTDSIMQTMYRLEMELAELQRSYKSVTHGGSQRAVEEIQEIIKNLKETKLDRDQLSEIAKGLPGQSTKQAGSDKAQDTQEFVQKEVFKDNVTKVYRDIDALTKRLTNMERNIPYEPNYSAAGNIGINLPHAPGFGVQLARDELSAGRLQYTLARQYDIVVNNEMRKFHLPNPCFLRTRPRTVPHDVEKTANRHKTATDNFYIKGRDGKMYLGTGTPAVLVGTSTSGKQKSQPTKGKNTSQKFKKTRGGPSPNKLSPNAQKREHAATKIQAGFRGMQTRKSLDSQTSFNATANCVMARPNLEHNGFVWIPPASDNCSDNCSTDELDFYM